MRNEPKVAIIILNWNGKHLLKDCLTSLRRYTEYSNYNTIIVDNGSADGSVEFLRREFPWVDVLALDRNYGFAGGNNRGIIYALKKYNPDYVLLLNNDVIIFQKDWLRKMIEVAESNEKIGIVGCKLVYPDGRTQHIGGVVDRITGDGKHITIESSFKKVIYPEYVCGACFLIKREIIDIIGLLDERFFPAYYEDVDYCFRVRKAGYLIACVTSVRLIHKEGSTSKRFDILFFHMKNRIRFILLNFPFVYIILCSVILIFSSFFKRKEKNRNVMLDLTVRKDWEDRLVVVFNAWLVNLKQFNEILIKRINRTKRLWETYK